MLRTKYKPEDELQDSIASLTDIGCDERQLKAFGLLLFTVTSQMEPAKPLLQELEAIRKDVPKILDAAERLDRINSHRWIGTNGLRLTFGLEHPLIPVSSPDQEKVGHLARMVEQLPEMIRSYTHLLAMQVDLLHRAARTRGNHPFRDHIKLSLIEYVAECAGNPHYDLISTFLEAFRIANGGADDVEEAEFSVQALQQFASRYRRRIARTRQT